MTVISVVVPVYNVFPYLTACVDSILCQTFRDFELLLIDDGSTDGSGALCDAYAEKDNRIRVFHQTNQGQSAARNLGVKEAKAEIICFIDSDDIAHPRMIECLFEAMKATDAGAAVSARIYGKELPFGFFEAKEEQIQTIEINESTLLRLLKENNTIYWTLFPCLLHKSIYTKYPLTPGHVMEDNAVACKWLYEAGRVAILQAPYYFYRENPDSTMSAAFSPKKLDFLWALEEQLSFYKSIGYSTMQRLIWNEYFETAIWFFNRIMTELRDPALAKSVISRTKRIQKEFGFPLSEAQRQKLLKTVHPLLHKINKHLKNHGISICK